MAVANDDYRCMFDREYIGAWDLAGRDVTVTIERVEPVVVGRGKQKDKKPLITLRGTEKKFLCNRTNGDTIAAIYGPKTSKWIGKQITLFPTQAQMGGKSVDAIRVRPTAPKGKQSVGIESKPVDEEMRAKQNEAAESVEADADGVVSE